MEVGLPVLYSLKREVMIKDKLLAHRSLNATAESASDQTFEYRGEGV